MSGELQRERQQSVEQRREVWCGMSLRKQTPESGVTVGVLCFILKAAMT